MSKELKLIFGIYLEDGKYSQAPCKIISPIGQEFKGIILLNFKQGSNSETGHYSGIRLFNNHFLGNMNINSFKNHLNPSEVEMHDKAELNILIMNVRSINDYLKRLFLIDLIDILRNRQIDIAFIQETFLNKNDKLYFSGYKIFRSNNEIQRRKDVAILINTKLNVETQKLAIDPDGRFKKLRIKNKLDNNLINISNIYLEPNGELDYINKIIFDADIIGGDMNKSNSGLNTLGVTTIRTLK